ncbi:unnamed protein product [Pleuronectes platessa]|uniref:Uncharacterized protein n=1 Tax=Pleuronectes platessa TaxID=8262 RepID=A0A9N7TWD7_PLEPL|nr:unnamed protein product [Pleuronectes platessa]
MAVPRCFHSLKLQKWFVDSNTSPTSSIGTVVMKWSEGGLCWSSPVESPSAPLTPGPPGNAAVLTQLARGSGEPLMTVVEEEEEEEERRETLPRRRDERPPPPQTHDFPRSDLVEKRESQKDVRHNREEEKKKRKKKEQLSNQKSPTLPGKN